jgi:diguanylate cyclase (GGDEF)-like protein
MSDVLGTGRDAATVETLAVPVDVVDADVPVTDLDVRFRADPGLECLAVRPPSRPTLHPVDVGGGWGLVTRARFQQLMTGPLGYGRLLLARESAQAVADWSPLVVDAADEVADVARAVVEHDEHDGAAVPGVTDVLVVREGRELRRVPVATVFRALSGQLALQALTDPLTGLANRDHFLQHLDRCCREQVPGERLAVVYVDLDGFKAFNDGYGHGVGDRVLEVVAERLRGSCRPQDLPARLGGDEFAVVVRLPGDVPAQQAADGLGRRVLACLGGTITVGQLVLPGRASVGVAVAADPPPASTPAAPTTGDPAEGFAQADLLVREADLAMYRAKVAGGHRAHVVTGVGPGPGDRAAPVDRRALDRAVRAGEFVLHYQPITEVGTGRLASVEALVRWQHPTRGLLAPGEFLDAVADAGFAAELDRHVLAQALGQLRVWTERLGPQAPPSVNVNLSVQGLLAPDLAEDVLTAVRDRGVAADRLRLELPEAATLEHLQTAGDGLARLRSAGVRLTLDDLGAGASTLHHLTELALDGVKVDRRFVAGMLQDERDAAVVRMLLELGLGTGLAVTVEGVETVEQLALLTQVARGRTVHVQGWLVGRPVPASALGLPWSAGVRWSSSASV